MHQQWSLPAYGQRPPRPHLQRPPWVQRRFNDVWKCAACGAGHTDSWKECRRCGQPRPPSQAKPW
eukprot:15049814-Alexandrium_andersonii.AAC.1